MQVSSINYGKVIFIGSDFKSQCVVVQINQDECIRYNNLSSVSVSLNEIVQRGTIVGQTSNSISIEYFTTWQGNSKTPLRISTKTYYKQSANDIIVGLYEPYESYRSVIITKPYNRIELSPAQMKEFGDNRGDNKVG